MIRHLHFYTFQKLYLTSKMNSKSFVTVLLVTFMIGAMMVEIAEAGCDSNGCCNCSRYIYSRHNVIILRNRVITHDTIMHQASRTLLYFSGNQVESVLQLVLMPVTAPTNVRVQSGLECVMECAVGSLCGDNL